MKAKTNKEAKSYCKSLEILPTKGSKKIQNLNTQTNTVAVEISRSPKNDMSYQIVSRYTLGKFAEFGVHCIAYMLLKPQVYIQNWCGTQKPSRYGKNTRQIL